MTSNAAELERLRLVLSEQEFELDSLKQDEAEQDEIMAMETEIARTKRAIRIIERRQR